MPPGSGLQVRARAPHSPRTYGLPAAARPTGRDQINVTYSVTFVKLRHYHSDVSPIATAVTLAVLSGASATENPPCAYP
jgi:hypothetical protein